MASIMKLMSADEPPVDDTSNGMRLVRDSLVEFMATAVFVYVGVLSAVSTQAKVAEQEMDGHDVALVFPIAFAFGVAILVLAYSIGHLSGGHMNPAVSLMMFLRRQMSIQKMACYWVCQFVGAMLGVALVWGSTSELEGSVNKTDVNRPPFLLGSTTLSPRLSTGNGFLLELMGSFFFFLVIAQTALDGRGIGGSQFPAIPIGLSLVVAHIGLIPFTGCGLNPARTFGSSIVVCMTGDHCDIVVPDSYWIYWAGPFLGAFLAAEVTTWLEMDVDGEPAADTAAAPDSPVKEEGSPEELAA